MGHPLTGTHETAFDAIAAAPLSGLKRASAPALELTASDLSLPPGPPAISAKALMTDALELLKESGVSPMQAITTAGTRLGYPMAADMDSGAPSELFKAVGPVSLPLLSGVSPFYSKEGLTTWKLDLNGVMPALVEQGREAPDLYRIGLRALLTNSHLSEPQVLAVQDALIRTELTGGRAQAPVLDGSASLDGLVANLRQLAQGEAFGEALPVVSRLVRAGMPFDADSMKALVDRALDSPAVSTRTKAAGLFWQSSVTSEAGVKAYLQSLFETGRWSAEARRAAIERFEANPTWERPSAGHNLADDATGVALAQLLESAPANAEVLPAVIAAPWPWGNNNPKLELVDKARAALWWSSLAPERLIATADGLGERLTSNTFRGDVLGQLLVKHPHLASLAPKLLKDQARGPLEVEQLSRAPDYLAALRALRAELEAMPPPPPHNGGMSTPDLAARRKYQLWSIDRVLSGPTREAVLEWLANDKNNHWQEMVALEQGRELGLPAQLMFDTLIARRLSSTPAAQAAAELLADPSLSYETFATHFAKVMASAPKGAPSENVMKTLLRRAPTKEVAAGLLSTSLETPEAAHFIATELLRAGFDRDFALAFSQGRSEKKYEPRFELALAPSNEPVRGLREAQAARMADFRERAAAEPLVERKPRQTAGMVTREPGFFEASLRGALDDKSLTASDEVLDATFGAVGAPGRDTNSLRFLIDVRRGRPYAELRELYGTEQGPYRDVMVDWAYADEAAPADQMAVLLGNSGRHTWVSTLAAVASPALNVEQKQRAALNAFSRASLGSESPAPLLEIAALEYAWEGSLDFVAPVIRAAVQDANVLAGPMASLTSVLVSPKLSKALALDLVWQIAERSNPHSSLGLGKDFEFSARGHSQHSALWVLEEFVSRRTDLTEPERAHLRGAASYLARVNPRLG